MTLLKKSNKLDLGAFLLASLFSMSLMPVSLVQAEELTTEQLIEQLQLQPEPEEKPKTRGFVVGGGNADTEGDGSSTRGVSVVMPQQTGQPSVDMRVNFEFGSTDLTRQAKRILDNLGKALNSDQLKDARFVIAGHTDAVGSESYNKQLSLDRAESVRRYLMETHRVDQARLVTEGLGESELLRPESPEDPYNRRVQIINLGNDG